MGRVHGDCSLSCPVRGRYTQSDTMIQLSILVCATTMVLSSPVADPKAFGVGYGHVSPCVTEPDTIPVSACRLEPEKVCTTETIVVGKKVTGHEDPVCEEVKGCAPHIGYHGKREAEAGIFGHALGYHGCVETTHQVCQPGKPIIEDVTKDVETCTVTQKEVCDEIQKHVPKTTCKTAKLNH